MKPFFKLKPLNTSRINSRRPFFKGPVPRQYCPETGEEVFYEGCALNCPKYGVHAEGDLPRCQYEYEELKDSGFYARTDEEWLDHLQHADPETWQRLIEEKRNNERVRTVMEAEHTRNEQRTEQQERRDKESHEQDDENKDSTDQTHHPQNDEDDEEGIWW